MATPVNTVIPTISGTAATGQTLTASTGTWTVDPITYTYLTPTTGTWVNDPSVFTYQWYRGSSTVITGATSMTYMPVTADVGSTLKVTVTATNTEGAASATSLATASVTAGGSISGSVTTYTTTQSTNLTSLASSGLSDWAAFGYTANASSIARKSSGGSAISALSSVGSPTLGNWNNAGYSPIFQCTWSDGASPNTSATNEAYLVYASGASGTGYSFTVPADTTSRTIKVYVQINADSSSTTSGKLTATLTDSSASPYVDTTLTETNASTSLPGIYTIVYNAGSASQSLTVQWINNGASAITNASIYAVVIE